jgi:hypothetical protein
MVKYLHGTTSGDCEFIGDAQRADTHKTYAAEIAKH